MPVPQYTKLLVNSGSASSSDNEEEIDVEEAALARAKATATRSGARFRLPQLCTARCALVVAVPLLLVGVTLGLLFLIDYGPLPPSAPAAQSDYRFDNGPAIPDSILTVNANEFVYAPGDVAPPPPALEPSAQPAAASPLGTIVDSMQAAQLNLAARVGSRKAFQCTLQSSADAPALHLVFAQYTDHNRSAYGLLCYSVEQGIYLWSQPTPGPAEHFLCDQLTCIIAGPSFFRVLHCQTGDLRWEFEVDLSGERLSAPVLENGVVWVVKQVDRTDDKAAVRSARQAAPADAAPMPRVLTLIVYDVPGSVLAQYDILTARSADDVSCTLLSLFRWRHSTFVALLCANNASLSLHRLANQSLDWIGSIDMHQTNSSKLFLSVNDDRLLIVANSVEGTVQLIEVALHEDAEAGGQLNASVLWSRANATCDQAALSVPGNERSLWTLVVNEHNNSEESGLACERRSLVVLDSGSGQAVHEARTDGRLVYEPVPWPQRSRLILFDYDSAARLLLVQSLSLGAASPGVADQRDIVVSEPLQLPHDTDTYLLEGHVVHVDKVAAAKRDADALAMPDAGADVLVFWHETDQQQLKVVHVLLA